MKRAGRTLTAAIGGALLLAACGDAAQLTTPAVPNTGVRASSQTNPPALAELTRSLALAMNDRGLRNRIKTDMRKAPFSEHKLMFSDYLRGQSGGIVLAKMARESGQSREQVLALLAQLPPLEFYMPVADHRESWTGGADLIVAGSIMGDRAAPIGYDLQGQPVALSADVAPATPTMVLVPLETDFSRALDAAKARNVRDRGGDAIGTLSTLEDGSGCSGDLEAVDASCDGGGGGGGGGGSYTGTPSSIVRQRGISVEEFITHMRAHDDHEPWHLGAPEFYLLLAGKYSSNADFKSRVNIPEGPWDGSSDSGNARWRNFGNMPLILWDVDLGSRITVQCMEDDFDWESTITVGGSTEFPDIPGPTGSQKLNYSISFKVGWGDDDCGSSFINMRNSQGAWYHIPDGVNNDFSEPVVPYFNGTSDLQWYGYGLKRI